MTDLRALLYSSWCLKCHGPSNAADCRSHKLAKPIATRLPECVPPGLICDRSVTDEGFWKMVAQGCATWNVSASTAELLFIGQAVKVLMGEVGCRFYRENDVWWSISNGNQTVSAEPLDALTAALHRLADEREAA